MISLLGTKIDVVGINDVLQFMIKRSSVDQISFVNNVNIHTLNLSYKDREFREVLNKSDIVFCDGFGVKLGAWICGKKLGERMTPPDWVDRLFELGSDKGLGFYFVGDEPSVVEIFVKCVSDKYPDLKICGYHHGFYEIGSDIDNSLVSEINKSGADIIITGMGMPRQEKWAWFHRNDVKKGVFFATGAMFRWYSGYEKRFPRWVTDNGLEWLARLICKPRLLWRRYVIGNSIFMFRVLKEAFYLRVMKRT